ncbi:MAG: alpha/beta hydrolase fold domain-containing protein [Planctomycetes bacterium]|nr:alpha/beta hydrolase fold domain-containing protein [Planctomycetota bacterium]
MLPVVVVSAAPWETVRLGDSFYLLSRPADWPETEPLPLILALHGTDTTAADFINFWSNLDATVPFAIVAPQATGPGWHSDDVAFLKNVVADIPRRLAIDRSRILLTGHSAGGAMALHMLYAERIPATAAVVTANYVPPTFEADDVTARADVPLYYAVGQSDTNFEPMRAGLEVLRQKGVHVTVARPRIGHSLDSDVAQAALKWFEALCRSRTQAVVDHARRQCEQATSNPGPAAAAVEKLLEYRASHPPDQMTEAEAIVKDLLEPGRATLARARQLVHEERLVDAHAVYLSIEQRYRESSLGIDAQRERQQVESSPAVQDHLSERARAEQARSAETLWQQALIALRGSRISETRRQCANLVALYPQAEQARQAQALLDLLERPEAGR